MLWCAGVVSSYGLDLTFFFVSKEENKKYALSLIVVHWLQNVNDICPPSIAGFIARRLFPIIHEVFTLRSKLIQKAHHCNVSFTGGYM